MAKLKPWTWFNREPVSIEIESPVNHDEIVAMPSIVLIHGAHQSNVTFEYFRNALPGFQYINIEWSSTGGFYHNLDEMVQVLKTAGPVYLVGHSMGGIYAAHAAQKIDCVGGATIATPWGGSKIADWAKYIYPSYPIYREVSTASSAILDARLYDLPGMWTNYVSTQGNVPGMGGPNDCVLTIESMTARKDIKTKFISATHYEIIMSGKLIQSVCKNYLRASENSTFRS